MIMKKSDLLLLIIFLFQSPLIFSQGIEVSPGTCIKIESETTLDVSTGDLIIKSDVTGDASLIDDGNITFSGEGTTKVERYLTLGEWHLISSPINTAQAGMFEDQYLQMHTESTYAYSDITSMTYELIPGKGYALWLLEGKATTKIFEGATNTGAHNFSFTKTEFANEDHEGWNLAGNPYPSVLD